MVLQEADLVRFSPLFESKRKETEQMAQKTYKVRLMYWEGDTLVVFTTEGQKLILDAYSISYIPDTTVTMEDDLELKAGA